MKRVVALFTAVLAATVTALVPGSSAQRQSFPLASGDTLYQTAGEDTHLCTVGFVATGQEGGKVALTAGHCNHSSVVMQKDDGTCHDREDHVQASCASPKASIGYTGLGSGDVNAPPRIAGTYMYSDVTIDQENSTTWGKWVLQDRGAISILDTVPTTSLVAGKYRLGRVLDEDELSHRLGDEVCKYGAITGETCGTLHSVGSIFADIRHIYIEHGDSGGPVYILDGEGAHPIGVVSHFAPYARRMASTLVAPVLREWNLSLEP